ncbi:MAG: methionine--tRNA ligase [Microbacteriaceae bacterium]
MPTGKPFYITTPIFYVNDVPHIGHAYTEVAADFLARWHRLRGDKTWLLTGTDEHGQKILRTATANGYEPKAWADKLVETAWLPLLETVNISNDDFIRTTEERHEKNVAKFLELLKENGHVYTGEFAGYYCVGCEEYKLERELIDDNGVMVCSIHSKPVELLEERNYFFRMSDFTQQLLDFYEANPDFIQPESARNEVLAFVKGGLEDLSISRSSFDWGIKIPWDDSHVVYVWFEALLNYITAIGFGEDEEKFESLWPGVHLVGKDILRFHAVIWPAMLMAAGLPTPHKVFGHGWLLVGGEKMSKSKLTGIAPAQITDTFGSDAFRYYFMRAISFGQDGSFSWEDLQNRYTSELANGFGNLASRVIAMTERYFEGKIPAALELSDTDQAIVALAANVADRADEAMTNYAPHEALAAIWELVDELNGYLTIQEPWKLAKDAEQLPRVGTVLNVSLEALRVLAILLEPIIPIATAKLWAGLGADQSIGSLADERLDDAKAWAKLPVGSLVHKIDSLFPRIEEEAAVAASSGNQAE